MAKGKKHKSQHYVPRSYTAAWTDPRTPKGEKPYVWLFPADGGDGKRKSPKNTFEATDFYTIERADGERDLVLEHGLSQLETQFAKVRKALAARQKLSNDEYFYLLAFIAAMDGRTKAQRDHERQQWGKAKDLMELMIRQWDRSTPKERESLSRMSAGVHDKDTPSLSYDDVVELVSDPLRYTLPVTMRTLVPIYRQMNLAILQTNDPIGFITSDDPVVTFDPEAYKRSPMFRSPGLAIRSTEVTFPISPEQLLVFSWHPVVGYVDIPVNIVDGFNRRTRFYADEYFVVRCNKTKDVWFRTDPEPDDSWEKTHGKRSRPGSSPGVSGNDDTPPGSG